MIKKLFFTVLFSSCIPAWSMDIPAWERCLFFLTNIKPCKVPQEFKEIKIKNTSDKDVELILTFHYLSLVTSVPILSLGAIHQDKALQQFNTKPFTVQALETMQFTPEPISLNGHPWDKSHIIGLAQAKFANLSAKNPPIEISQSDDG